MIPWVARVNQKQAILVAKLIDGVPSTNAALAASLIRTLAAQSTSKSATLGSLILFHHEHEWTTPAQ
jgi:hypothetical protein